MLHIPYDGMYGMNQDRLKWLQESRNTPPRPWNCRYAFLVDEASRPSQAILDRTPLLQPEVEGIWQ